LGNYIFTDHTADIAVEIKAESCEGLFISAAFAIRECVFQKYKGNNKSEYKISLPADSLEDLLINFLNELNYFFLTKKFIFNSVKSLSISSANNILKLDVILLGEQFSSGKHKFVNEIKAVTYHNAVIEKKNNLYSVKLVIDI